VQAAIPKGKWPADPVSCGARGAVVAVAGTRHIFCVDDSSSIAHNWAYSLPGVTTLSGRPPRVATFGDAILVLIETNIGYRLQRLCRDTGEPMWRVPAPLSEPVTDPSDWAASDDAVFLIERGVLTGRSLRDGHLLWETPLGSADRNWRVQRVANGLLAFPTATGGAQFAFRWMNRRLQWNVVPDLGEACGGGFPLVCCDEQGRVVQRFEFASRGTALHTIDSLHGPLALAPIVLAWRGPVDGCLPVHVNEHGIVVVVGPRAWGLAPTAVK
jgi:hypothetical protein